MTTVNSLSSTMSSMSSNASSSLYPSGNTGMNMSDLMAPLMLLMMERLIEKTLEDDSSSTATATGQASSAASNTPTGAVYGSHPEPSGAPVDNVRITQYPHTGHMAFDIGIPVGTNVKSTMDGNVVYAGWNDQGYGNLVIVENGAYRTYYAHLSSIPVSVGDQVTSGTTIGLSGNTGNSTGPHLHYEVRRNKVTIDPTASMLGS